MSTSGDEVRQKHLQEDVGVDAEGDVSGLHHGKLRISSDLDTADQRRLLEQRYHLGLDAVKEDWVVPEDEVEVGVDERLDVVRTPVRLPGVPEG